MVQQDEFQKFEEEFFLKMRNKEAWSNISKGDKIIWSDKFIEKHADELNWTELCDNDSGLPNKFATIFLKPLF